MKNIRVESRNLRLWILILVVVELFLINSIVHITSSAMILRGEAGEIRPAATPTPAPKRTRPQSVKNQIGIEMVWIPPGSFAMGSTDSEVQAAYENEKNYFGDVGTVATFTKEKPRHQVTIREGFYMGRYEVTQAQWQAVMRTTVQQQRDKANTSYPMRGEGDSYPMYYVSWKEAQEFIGTLNQMNDGYTYRLPSEAEWEYACRARTTTAFAFGDSLSSDQANFDGNYPYGGAGKSVDRGKVTPVGTFQPNAFGLYDMHGNVLEWCQDKDHGSYNGAPGDGTAWLSGGEQEYQILRGGSWYDPASRLRSGGRSSLAPDYRNYGNGAVGFRVVAVARTR